DLALLQQAPGDFKTSLRDREGLDLGEVVPAGMLGVVAGARRAAGMLADEYVQTIGRHVFGRRHVGHAEQRQLAGAKPGLLEQFPPRRLLGCLAILDPAARKGIHAARRSMSPPDEKQARPADEHGRYGPD